MDTNDCLGQELPESLSARRAPMALRMPDLALALGQLTNMMFMTRFPRRQARSRRPRQHLGEHRRSFWLDSR